MNFRRAGRRVFCSIFLLLALGEIAYLHGYRVNFLTPSSPVGLWKSDAAIRRLERGDYVCADTTAMMEEYPAVRDAHERGYFGHRLFSREPYDLLKRIGGIPGDIVEYDSAAERLIIDGKIQESGILLDMDSKGRSLQHPNFPYILAENEYWLASDHRYGFDSRYFGGIPGKFIKSRMIAVCVWQEK